MARFGEMAWLETRQGKLKVTGAKLESVDPAAVVVPHAPTLTILLDNGFPQEHSCCAPFFGLQI